MYSPPPTPASRPSSAVWWVIVVSSKSPPPPLSPSRLYASLLFLSSGEVACTGLHGANRLASTSLLEGLVWGCSIADHLADRTMGDCKDGLAASANLGAVLDANVPGNDAPVASPKAVSAAWDDLRCVCVCVCFSCPCFVLPQLIILRRLSDWLDQDAMLSLENCLYAGYTNAWGQMYRLVDMVQARPFLGVGGRWCCHGNGVVLSGRLLEARPLGVVYVGHRRRRVHGTIVNQWHYYHG